MFLRKLVISISLITPDFNILLGLLLLASTGIDNRDLHVMDFDVEFSHYKNTFKFNLIITKTKVPQYTQVWPDRE